MAFSERYPCGSMSLHPPGFIEPCLPTGSRTVPTGPQWAYEIKHDGFRFVCRGSLDRVKGEGSREVTTSNAARLIILVAPVARRPACKLDGGRRRSHGRRIRCILRSRHYVPPVYLAIPARDIARDPIHTLRPR